MTNDPDDLVAATSYAVAFLEQMAVKCREMDPKLIQPIPLTEPLSDYQRGYLRGKGIDPDHVDPAIWGVCPRCEGIGVYNCAADVVCDGSGIVTYPVLVDAEEFLSWLGKAFEDVSHPQDTCECSKCQDSLLHWHTRNPAGCSECGGHYLVVAGCQCYERTCPGFVGEHPITGHWSYSNGAGCPHGSVFCPLCEDRDTAQGLREVLQQVGMYPAEPDEEDAPHHDTPGGY